MDTSINIFLAIAGGAIYLFTRTSRVRASLLPAMQAIGFACIALATSGITGQIPGHYRTFSILQLAAVGLIFSTLGLISRYNTKNRPESSFNSLMAVQFILGILILASVIAAPESVKRVESGSPENFISSLALVGVLFLLVCAAILFFKPAWNLFKHSTLQTAAPAVPAILNLLALSLYHNPVLKIFAFAGMLLAAYALASEYPRRHQSIGTSFERRKIIDTIKLGWMILDDNNNIVDVNPFIEIITGQSAEKLRGKSTKDILTNGDILPQENNLSEYSVLARVDFHGFMYSFDVRSLPLLKENGDLNGRLLLWQDITEQKKLEEARHRALATRINLMRSISTAANHITDINIFLEAAIFQIVSSFGGLAGFVFTRDSDFIGDEKAGFKLNAAYSYDEILDNKKVTQTLEKYLADLSAGSRCLHLQNISAAGLLAGSTLENQTGDLLICPIVIDEHLQGAVCVFKIGAIPFESDDSAGLEMIANELSMLIYVDHQRRLAVSFAERKKLVRDLHDTVTQQLYGLLYQVEITQAQLELNRTETLPNSLTKIGSIARQALREMRLFLHELQPVDLKNEGLVSALHRRLTAVEGRANIHPRFISPEFLEISLQQELNLYQIAREALNNVLRHSSAKNVTVHLTEKGGNLCLEITDDGLGFEKSALKNSAGMGFKNIKEWVAQIHAKIQIQSKPGNGTRIKVLVPKTNTNN
jgi:PAS domain S-box-containing protein